MRRLLGGIGMAGVLLVVVPGMLGNAARAHETTDGYVSASHCILTDGGAATITAGSEVIIRQGWLTHLRGDQITFLGAQASIVSVNDGQMWDASDQWGAPTGSGSDWSTTAYVPTGITLAAGEQLRFTFAMTLQRDVFADMGYGAGPNQYHAGLLFGGTCTVTAE